MRKQATAIILSLLPLAPSSGQQVLSNYVRMMEYTDSLSAACSSSWFDGLGRPYAEVRHDQSPSGGDIVTVKAYDGRGLIYREWLPVHMPSLLSAPDAAEAAATAASAMGYSDGAPYTEHAYEQAPLGRPVSHTGPGAAWRTHGKCMTTAYGLNPQADVVRYSAAYSGTTLTAMGYYASGELDWARQIGEDGMVTTEYTDLFGRKVMAEHGGLRTYYVYDNASNLRFVLPPALDGVLPVGGSYNLLTCQALRDLAYFYSYDRRGLCTERKFPGCDPVTMVYDDGGRMAFSQDGRQRSAGQWTFTLYDELGRVVVTGVHASTSAPVLTGADALAWYTGDGPLGGYTTDVGLNVNRLLTVCYYDGYEFLLHHAVADSMSCRFLPSYEEAVGFSSGDAYRVRGMLTGSVTYLTSGSDSLTEAIYYDSEGRRVQSHRRNTGGGWEHYYHRLNAYTGDLLTLRHDHSASGYPSLTETMAYTYDNARRPLTTTHSVNGSTPVTLSSLTYDAVGRLATKTVGGLETTAYTYNVRSWPTRLLGQRFTERLCYNEAVEGLSPVLEHEYRFDGTVSAYACHVAGETFQRGYTLMYDGLNRLTAAHYGESSSLGSYHTKYDEMAEYDCMGNPTWIYRRSPDVINDIRPSSPSDRLRLEYDGNQLVHVTDSVTSGHNYVGAFHFADGADETVEYEYDGNGNMTKDSNRNITSIEYNLLNLPSMINFGDNSFIKYTYSATGEKLGVRYGVRLQPVLSPTGRDAIASESADATETMQDRSGGFDPGPLVPMAMDGITYCGNVVYDGDEVKLLTDEGYVTFTATGTPQYHYYLRDHLGNIRVVMGQTGALEQVNHYYAFGGLMRESTNPGVQPYKFGGKELDRTSGLDAYDFGARMYFADRMQWGQVDPMCEKYYSVSPYAYCENNPVMQIDPDGKENLVFLRPKDRELIDVSNYDPNTSGVINIWIHGGGINNKTKYAQYLDKPNGRYDTNNIHVTKDNFVKEILRRSEEWKKDDGNNVIIVLHSCGSYELAKQISTDKELASKNVVVIAPNDNLIIDTDYYNNKTTTFKGYAKDGAWIAYRKGAEIKRYNQTQHPGKKGFHYGFDGK